MANGDTAHELVVQILKSRMTFRQTVQRMLKQHNMDMTFEMLQIMYRLWIEQGVSQQFLAEKTAKDKACLTNLINNLEKKGWVKREENPVDRRNRLVYLTREGDRLREQALPLLHTIYEKVGEKISLSQLESCNKYLKKLNNVLNEI